MSRPLIVTNLVVLEDGSLSNPKVEQFALMLAEQETSPYNAMIIIFTEGGRKKNPSGQYIAQLKRTPAFLDRVQLLMDEKAKLTANPEDHFGQLMWQVKQLWRKAVAMNDANLMAKANEQLMSAMKMMSAGKPKEPEAEEEGEKKPRGKVGAPAAFVPEPAANEGPDPLDVALLAKK